MQSTKEIAKSVRKHDNRKNLASNECAKPSSEKKVKTNPQTLPVGKSPSHNRNDTMTNWEKFRDIVKDATSEQSNPRPKKQKFSGSSRPMFEEGSAKPVVNGSSRKIPLPKKTGSLSKEVAMDCEMVGIGDGTESILARVSLVNRYGDCIYDKYVKPTEWVTDYRTAVSGIRPHHLKDGEDFAVVQREVAEILRGRILVGHAVHHDTDVLFLSHPKRQIRDTSRYKPFRMVSNGGTPSLRKLAKELLGIDIQSGEHSSIEDARTTMQLYMIYKTQWESNLRNKRRA